MPFCLIIITILIHSTLLSLATNITASTPPRFSTLSDCYLQSAIQTQQQRQIIQLMQDIDHLDLISKLNRILATLHDDMHRNQLEHQREIRQLRTIIQAKDHQIQRLKQIATSTLDLTARTKKKSMDDSQNSKPLFARKRSAIVTQLTVDIPQQPKTIHPSTTKNQPLQSHTSTSSLFNSKEKLLTKNKSNQKYNLMHSRQKKSETKITEAFSDRKQYGVHKKIDIKNKENKQPIAVETKTISNTASKTKLVKLFQRIPDNAASSKRSLRQDKSELLCSKGSEGAGNQQEKKFINIYIPGKAPQEKRQWR